LSFVLGTALWTATAIAGGRAEPWDSALYWSASYPSALALAAAIGFLFPDRPWRWAVVLVFTQLPVMAVSAPGLGLLPLALVMLGLLSLPAILLAAVAARIRRALA
jgi:hypothetical protein